MTRRRDDAIKTKAAICSNFNVAWSEYGTLTLREHNALVEILKQQDKPTRPGQTTNPRSNLERVV